MKTTLAVFALSLSFATTSFGAELLLRSHNTLTLKRTDKNTFEKINEVSIVEISITSTVVNTKNTQKFINNDRLTYTLGENVIRIDDDGSFVYQDVEAKIERTFLLGKVKSFSISGENLENAYYDALTKSGIIALSELDQRRNSRKSLSISNLNCLVEKSSGIARCEYDLDLKVQNNGFVLGAAVLALQLGQAVK